MNLDTSPAHPSTRLPPMIMPKKMHVRSARIHCDDGRSGTLVVNGRIAADGDPIPAGARVTLLLDSGTCDPLDSSPRSGDVLSLDVFDAEAS